MLEKYYFKIAKPTALAFACLCGLISIDFILPKETNHAIIEGMTKHRAFHIRYSFPSSFSIEIAS